MRTFNLVSLVSVVAVACAHGAPVTGPPDPDAVRKVRDLVIAHAAAVEARDVKKLDTLYSASPDLLVIEGAGADKGWANYRDHHLGPELQSLETLTYKYDGVRVDVSGDLAWATFDYELHAVAKQQPIDITGKGTMILRRSGKVWQIVHSHTSGRPIAKK